MKNNSNLPILSIVIPCYNEEDVLENTMEKVSQFLQEAISNNIISAKSFLMFVDDGSSDDTWKIITSFSQFNSFIKAIKLSKNQGHQQALWAGMTSVVHECDCMVSLDADLQDDLYAINKMLKKYKEGYEIVLGVRNDRQVDSFFKKYTAESYYRLMKFMGVNLIFNHADYRLLSNKALDYLLQFQERNLFIRGLIIFLGLKRTMVHYQRKERMGGESKYPLKKMISLAWEGITSFSVIPLKIITFLGFFIFIASMFMGVYIFYIALLTEKAVPGWASTTLPIYFIGGIQLLSIGILGEYIGKIYIETKHRPHYFIEEKI